MIGRKLRFAILCAASCSGCAPHSQVNKPEIPVTQWHEERNAGAQEIDQQWWRQFNDPLLNELIQTAQKHSPDIRIALARVAQARAQQASTLANQLPRLDAAASAARSRQSTTLANAIPIQVPVSNTYKAGFDASWELDIFGVEPALRAANAYTAISVANYEQALVTLSGDVAASYFTIRKLQNQIAVNQDNVRAQQDTLALTRSLSNAGKTSEADSAQAAALLASTSASLQPLQGSLSAEIYTLDTLLGQIPGTSSERLAAAQDFTIPAADQLLAAPAAVLANRPDVRAAEKQLHYTAALKDIATAQYFPSISLAALFGVASGSTAKLSNTESHNWSVSAGINIPLFDFGRIRAQIDEADAQGQEAIAQYEKTVLAALSDVESAISGYRSEQQHFADLSASVDANQLALTLAQVRYQHGLSSYLNVLVAQRALYDAKSLQADSQLNICIQAVRLYKALGGGWRTDEGMSEK